MKAILRYVQKVIALKQDGTICITIDTGEMGTLTVKNRSIVAASLDHSSGKEALETIKLANIIHMEFWVGITQRNDIQKMVAVQAETNALSPIPEEEMHPEGAPITIDGNELEAPPSDAISSETRRDEDQHTHLDESEIEALAEALTEYIGPAASILLEGSIEQAHDMDHLIELLSEELFSEKDRQEFRHKAYFLLGQG